MTTDEQTQVREAIQAALRVGHEYAQGGKVRDVNPVKAAHDTVTLLKNEVNARLATLIGEITEG